MSPFIHNGNKIYVTQQPYIEETNDHGTHYRAGAEYDKDGKTFDCLMIWKIKEGFIINDIEDECEACDWDEFQVVEMGEKL